MNEVVRILKQASRNHRCAECATDFDYRERPRSPFCSDRCRYRWRDRRRQGENQEKLRAKSRRYYARNREQILDRVAAKSRTRSHPCCDRMLGVWSDAGGTSSHRVFASMR